MWFELEWIYDIYFMKLAKRLCFFVCQSFLCNAKHTKSHVFRTDEKKTAYNWKIDIYRKKISKSIREREREEGWGEKESEKGMEGAA